MKVEPLASVKAHLSALLDEVARTHEQYTVTRNGQPVAVILAADDYESLMETIALLSDQTAMERLAEAERAVSEGELTTGEEMAAILAARHQRPAPA
jgi:prevent-host-death family protein